MQADTQLFCVEESSIQASCIPLLLSDLQRFLCRLEKGRILDALCILNKEDSMDIFTQVPSMNSWAALSHLWFLPRVFKAFPKAEALFTSIYLVQHLFNYQIHKNALGLDYRYLFDKTYLSQS